jgi:hypothetical protein
VAARQKTAAQTTLSNLALLFPEEDKKPEQASQVRACVRASGAGRACWWKRVLTQRWSCPRWPRRKRRR